MRRHVALGIALGAGLSAVGALIGHYAIRAPSPKALYLAVDDAWDPPKPEKQNDDLFPVAREAYECGVKRIFILSGNDVAPIVKVPFDQSQLKSFECFVDKLKMKYPNAYNIKYPSVYIDTKLND